MYLHSGRQLHQINFHVLLNLYIRSFQHSGQAFHTISITLSAFSHAFSKSFLSVLFQKFPSMV